MARPARIPTIHTVVLLITWLIESAASGGREERDREQGLGRRAAGGRAGARPAAGG